VVTALVLLHPHTAAVAGSLSTRWLSVGLVKDLARGGALRLNLQVGQNRDQLGADDNRAAAAAS